MSHVPERPPGANVTDPPTPTIDLSDPTLRAAWLVDLYEQTADALAAARDATAPPASRDLGRREARRIITDAEHSIGELLAAVGFVPSTLREQTLRAARRASSTAEQEHTTNEGAGELAALGAAVHDVLHAVSHDYEEDALHEMPLAGVLFLALAGSPGERAEIEPPLVLVLRALRATVTGWARMPRESTLFASIPLPDLDLFGRRIDAAIEIALRGHMERAS
jgi:hypothetical protein